MKLDMDLLWKLQQCESAVRALEEGLARMPRELDKARAEQEVRENELKACEAEHEEFLKKRRAVEADVEAVEQELQTNAGKQGTAKSNAELNAFKKEADFLKERKSGLETQVLEMFDAEDEYQDRIGSAKEQVEAAKRQAAARQKEIEERTAGEQAELERQRVERDSLARDLPAPVQSRFKSVAAAKGGVAVVAVQRGACGGCFNALPPQFVNEVRKSDQLRVCEACGRILIWVDGPGGSE